MTWKDSVSVISKTKGPGVTDEESVEIERVPAAPQKDAGVKEGSPPSLT